MLIIARNAVKLSAIALGLIAFTSLSINAQTNGSESFEFERIEVGEETNWGFSSEDEKPSLRDDIKELKDYSISDTDDSDIRITDEEPRFNNRGELQDFSIDADLYEY